MVEVWYPLDFMGCDNYDVSNQGRVRKHNKTSTRLMTVRTTALGHAYVGLTANGVQKNHAVAKLVLEAVKAPKMGYKANYILHLDGDRTNNHRDNLRWANKKTSMRYRRSYIREGKTSACTTRPVIEMNEKRLYKSIMDAARTYGIPPIDIYNQCEDVYSPETEALDERFHWVDWK